MGTVSVGGTVSPATGAMPLPVTERIATVTMMSKPSTREVIEAAIAAFDLINDETRAWSPSRDALQALLDGGLLEDHVAAKYELRMELTEGLDRELDQMRERCAKEADPYGQVVAAAIRNLSLRGKDE